MSETLAFLITWTTYGTWLPGDERGWVEEGKFEIQPPAPERRAAAQARMTQPPVTLTPAQRAVVAATIRAHCAYRSWPLHAVNVRSNHVHAVVTTDVEPETVMNQLKAWCSRRLNELTDPLPKGATKRWWTRHGSTKWIKDQSYFDNAVNYVLNMQD